MRNTQHAR